MAFKLMEQEKTYLELLKETKMLKHVGSGPVSPAPKEKETKSPVEDGTGAGTKQAATGHPNKIPPIAYLKKELAKEGIKLQGEASDELIAEIKDLDDNQKAIVRQKLSEMKGEDKMCPKCDCDPCECPKESDESEEDDDKKKVSKKELDEHCGLDHSKDKKKDKVDEQMMAPRGSTSDKIDARSRPAGSTRSGPLAGSPADRAAKAAAFHKQKQVWKQQAAAKAAAVPPQVLKQRRPVAPTKAPVRTTPRAQPLTPGGILPAPVKQSRSLRTPL